MDDMGARHCLQQFTRAGDCNRLVLHFHSVAMRRMVAARAQRHTRNGVCTVSARGQRHCLLRPGARSRRAAAAQNDPR